MAVDYPLISSITYELLKAIGEDPQREGLVGTPDRVARFWQEFIGYTDYNNLTTFEGVQTDQMVVVSGMRVWSMCEHHLLPFWCDISIGYIADDKVLGISKFARIAHLCAHKLQVQESLVHDIADAVTEATGTKDVAVVGTGSHTCMLMRGIRTVSEVTTSVMRGRFRVSDSARTEFLEFIRR